MKRRHVEIRRELKKINPTAPIHQRGMGLFSCRGRFDNGARSECMLRIINKTKQGNKRVVNLAWDGVFCFFPPFFFFS